MQPLEKTLRVKLENTVKTARRISEQAASASLEQLGVGAPSAFEHLNEEQRNLRRRLRVHGRQLGDARHTDHKTQKLDRLTEEVGYEHWHRMLFARFLAENNLLMYPDPNEPVSISLEDCADLAEDEGAGSGWELAAQYAARMLPQVFRLDTPVFELSLPPEYQQQLQQHVESLPTEVFTASDSLGWVYQFWQSDNKDQINKSETKIGARELPAVTQLFTEPYMVSFLLDNALGAWWAARRLTEQDLKTAISEEELRLKASIPGVPLDYLRFVQDEDGTWAPAAGTFDGWPEQLKDLTTLDPCCGSGHFLVSIFLMLVPMRMELDSLGARDAVDVVLRENIHGLELDQRCVELAAFALALTAWKYPNSDGYRALPELNLACSGLSVSVAKEEWKQLGLGKRNLTIALDWMYDTFHDAPVLGSLVNPAKLAASKIVSWDELSSSLGTALRQEQAVEQKESAIVAQGLAKASTLLSSQYQWVITNVPYLKSGKQCETLKQFCEKNYYSARKDLATVFVGRALELCSEKGTSSLVLPQNWLFLKGYKNFREELLLSSKWNVLARLGAGAFDAISGEVVKAILFTLTKEAAHSIVLGDSRAPENIISGFDVSSANDASEKSRGLIHNSALTATQESQLSNPDSVIVLGYSSGVQLSEHAIGVHGMNTKDSIRFIKNHWEIRYPRTDWILGQTTVEQSRHYGGLSNSYYWQGGNGHLAKLAETGMAVLAGGLAWDKKGICVREVGHLPSALYSGQKFDQNCGVIVPKDQSDLAALWCLCSSPKFNEEVREIDQSLKVTNATLVKPSFNLQLWREVARDKYPKGLPDPYSNDPTQWIFHGHPCGSVIWNEEIKWTVEGPKRSDETVLQIAVARLLGYRWPAELDSVMKLADEQRNWVNRCDALLPQADEDGIVCIPPIRGEAKAEDRLYSLLAAAYGDAWTSGTLSQLLASVDHAGKTLETWLRDKFFAQHCKLFQHRPFIWHVWDGLKDGFAALVNYHRLDRKMLETLIYTYLGDWIKIQRDDIARGLDGAEEKLAAAEALKNKLETILEGEAPYDIFVRWKPLKEQPIGWEPDLNDGVRMNIRPFLTIGDVGKRDAGVLRDRPNIKWTKDRGKDVNSAPWYENFQGERINDHHLTLTDKRAARGTQS